MLHKRFKQIMTVVNCFLVLPVGWVIIKEIIGPGPLNPIRILTTAALVAIPLCGTIAITVAGSAVLSKD